jgi:hypothetical protein
MLVKPWQEPVTLGGIQMAGGTLTAAKQILDVTDWDRFLSFYLLILASLIG